MFRERSPRELFVSLGDILDAYLRDIGRRRDAVEDARLAAGSVVATGRITSFALTSAHLNLVPPLLDPLPVICILFSPYLQICLRPS